MSRLEASIAPFTIDEDAGHLAVTMDYGVLD